MPNDKVMWTVDTCTCGHPVTVHGDGEGRCSSCEGDHHYGSAGPLPPICTRYQWDGEPRRRTW